MHTEIWKDIPEYEGKYRISTSGQIISLSRYDSRGEFRRGRTLKTTIDRDGYVRISLCRNGKRKGYGVHRLVALTFLENKENKPQVNHINGIKSDNRIENLEWVTVSENVKHSFENKLQIPISGEQIHSAKLTWEKVKFIRTKHSEGMTQGEIRNSYFPEVKQSTICRIINNKTWKNYAL